MCLELNAKKTDILQKEFNRRVKRNSHYSKRAFARDLGVSHTLLSLILSNKRQFSHALAKKLLDSTNYLSKNEKDFLKADFDAKKDRDDEVKSSEFVKLISDWTYYALLNLINISDFKWDAKWISERLGITEAKASSTMKKLIKLNLVEQLDSGQWVRKEKRISTKKEQMTESSKKFNKSLLKKASEAMDETSFFKRDLSSITFTMNPELIPYAVERIRNFRRNLSQELENLGDQTDVYTMSVQLFPLTKQE